MASFISLQNIVKKLKETGKYHIVFLGDSITSTEWVHPNWREVVEYILKKELEKIMEHWQDPSWGTRCFNAGFDGATTKDMLVKLDKYVINPDPNLVIIIGTRNDKDFKLSLREHKTNIQNIISRITQTGSDCVFCTSPTHLDYQIDPSYEPYVAEVSSIFPLPNSLFIDLYDKFRTLPLDRLYTFISEGNEVTGEKPGDTDPDHPNQLGNAYIAKVLLQEIFTIYFDPEKYIKSTLKGDKYPQY